MRNQSTCKNTGRRMFIKNKLFALAWAAGGTAVRYAQGIDILPSDDKKEDALFSFVQLNDTHIAIPERESSTYAKSNAKLKHVIEVINKEQKFKLPDFVILPGDLIHGGELKWLLPECRLAKQMLSELRCPYYTLIGNHEVVQREGDLLFQGPYEEVFGANRVNYHFIHKGILFICINNSGAKGAGDKVSDQRNKWLAEVLSTYPDLPKIVACHIPMVCLREEHVLSTSFGFSTYKMLGSETWEIIRKEKETVIAVLCGHLHLTGVAKVDGIMHICSSGTASYPCDFTHYTVYHDRIDVVMQQVGKDLVTPGTNIHGQKRHKRGFTDSAHATDEEYVAGTKGERTLSIPLLKAKRPT